jgi:mono/diheme cytochrome c family protein
MSAMTLLQFLTGLVIPILAYIIIVGSSFLSNKLKLLGSRLQKWTAVGGSLSMIVVAGVVILVAPPAAPSAEVQVANTLTEQIIAGQDLYSLNCVQCHGADGEGGIISGVQGLEGFNMKAIHSQDEMYTRSDETLGGIISYGQPNLGMQPFGKSYGGALSTSEIDYIVAFMRYTWDDRSVIPAGAVSTIPELNPGEVPSWDVHIQPLVKRYCVSCHRTGRQNNNYLMTSYQEMLTTGDNAPLITAGDPNSLLLTLINGHEGKDPVTGNVIRQMPPTKLLDPKYIDMLTRWVLAGMPQTAKEAAALAPTPTATPTGGVAPGVPTPTPTP